MDRYQNILKCLRQSWQQLRTLELTDSQRKDAFDLLIDQLIDLQYPTDSFQSSHRDNSVSKSTQNNPSLQPFDEWITISRASRITGRNRGTISKAASVGIIQNNGRRINYRRVLKSSVLLFHQASKEKKENKENSKEYYLRQRLENDISD